MDHTIKQREKDRGWVRYKPHQASNERGVALVLALVMLLVLGVIGAMSISTTSTELRIAGNYRNSMLGFYNANVPEAYGPLNINISQALNPYGAPKILTMPPTNNPGNDCPVAGVNQWVKRFQAGGVVAFCEPRPVPSGLIGSIWVRVEYLCMSAGSAGSATDADTFAEFHYLVTTVGKDATNAEYLAEVEVIQRGSKPPGVEPDCQDNTVNNI